MLLVVVDAAAALVQQQGHWVRVTGGWGAGGCVRGYCERLRERRLLVQRSVG